MQMHKAPLRAEAKSDLFYNICFYTLFRAFTMLLHKVLPNPANIIAHFFEKSYIFLRKTVL